MRRAWRWLRALQSRAGSHRPSVSTPGARRQSMWCRRHPASSSYSERASQQEIPGREMSVALDIVSSVLGFFGGVLLLITPIKGMPYRRTTEIAAAIEAKGLLSDLAQKDAKAA